MEEDRNSSLINLDLLQIIEALWAKVWLIAIAVILCAAMGFGYATYTIAPAYRASTSLFVNNNTISFGGTSLTLQGDNLLSTYAVILKSRVTLEDVIDEMGLNYSYEQLRSMISTSSVDGTQVFQISVTSSDPVEAERIANKLADIMPEKITDIMDGCSVRIVDYAVVPDTNISSGASRYTGIGALAGLVISCAVIILRFLLDTIIHDDDYLKAHFDIPVLTTIPDLLGSGSDGYYNAGYYASSQKSQQTQPRTARPGVSSSNSRKAGAPDE